jgi:polyhydroxybutyrate depolymerase
MAQAWCARAHRLALLLGLALGLTGCDQPGAGADAGSGGHDAGPVDARTVGADAHDPGPPDAGRPDEEPGDAGAGDAEPGDAGAGDAEPGDAGAGDAGATDVGAWRQGLVYDEPVPVGDLARTAHLYFPPRAAGETRPLVVLLHGNGGSADGVLGRFGGPAPFKVWLDVAARERLFLVVPDGVAGPTGEKGFNDCRGDAAGNPTTDDVAFVLTLLDALAPQGVDPKRVYATGLSNGGHMALRLAIEQPLRFAAVAPVAALMPAVSECAAPTTPVSVLFINGTADPICPYDGGIVGVTLLSGRGSVISTRDSLDAWRAVNGVTAAEVEHAVPDLTAADSCTATRVTAGPAFPTVAQLRIDDGGHTEPSITQRYSALHLLAMGRQNADVEMAEAVWTFFSTQAR